MRRIQLFALAATAALTTLPAGAQVYSRPDVQILGASEQIVHGCTPALFRFTSISTGPGGIAVGVEKVESQDRRLP